MLLIFVFGLTGLNMGLSFVPIMPSGVLGESNTGLGHGYGSTPSAATVTMTPTTTLTATVTVVPTIMATATPPAASGASFGEGVSGVGGTQGIMAVTATPTTASASAASMMAVIATESATPTEAVTTSALQVQNVITPTPTTVPSVSGMVQTSAGGVIQNVGAVDRSAGGTVIQIIRKLGVPAVTPTPAPTAAIVQAEKAVEDRTAGEILALLSETNEKSNVAGQEVRLRYIATDGQVNLVSETDTGIQRPLSPSDSAQVENRLEASNAVAVRSESGGGMVFSRGKITASTSLPLLVDLQSSLLMAQTSTLVKPVLLLPDEAINLAFASKVVDGVYPVKSDADIIFTEAANGRLVYEINGYSKRKLLGFYSVNLTERVIVDTQTGEVYQPEKGMTRLLLELVARPAGGN